MIPPQAVHEQIIALVEASMPSGADCRTFKLAGDLYVCVSWRLRDGPQDVEKDSRRLFIFTASDVIHALCHTSYTRLERAYARMRDYLVQELPSFDPTHEVPVGSPPPVEQWDITWDLLFGENT